MNFISKLFKKKEEETEVVSKGSVEEFVTLIRVYYQAVMAVQLGITNLNILNDMALFKRMLKIPTQNNKLGIPENSVPPKELLDAKRHQVLFHHVPGIQQRPLLPARQLDAMEVPLLHAGEKAVIFADPENDPRNRNPFGMERRRRSESRLENTEIQRDPRLFGRMDDRLRVQCRADGQRRCQKKEERRQIIS